MTACPVQWQRDVMSENEAYTWWSLCSSLLLFQKEDTLVWSLFRLMSELQGRWMQSTRLQYVTQFNL